MSESFDPYKKWLAISAEEQPPNHYRLLGVPEFEDDLETIEHAADRQMSHVRSFASGQHAAHSQQILNELSAARVCLLSRKKAAYDAELKRTRAASVAAATPFPTGTPGAVAPVMRPASQSAPQTEEFLFDSSQSGRTSLTARKNSRWQNPAVIGGIAVVVVALIAGGLLFGTRARPEAAATSKTNSTARSPQKPALPIDTLSDRKSSQGPLVTSARKTQSTAIVTRADTPITRLLPSFENQPKPIAAPSETVDLLKLIDLDQHVIYGEWSFDGDALVCPRGGVNDLVASPVEPPLEYDLLVEMTRLEGQNQFWIGLVCGDHRSVLTIGGSGGGLYLDGKYWFRNETHHRSPILVNGESKSLVCRVRTTGITVTCDEETIIGWKGDLKRLTLPPSQSIAGAKTKGIYLQGASTAAHRITRFEIRPISSDPNTN